MSHGSVDFNLSKKNGGKGKGEWKIIIQMETRVWNQSDLLKQQKDLKKSHQKNNAWKLNKEKKMKSERSHRMKFEYHTNNESRKNAFA